MAEQARSGAVRPRPLSPHIQIYRWPVTMATSIVHRATGLALAAGTLLVAWWLLALATGPDEYEFFSSIARGPIGQLVLFGFVWSLAFHLLNGIRHLAWDVGYGFDVHAANRSGVLVVTFSLFTAIGVFAFAYFAKGVHP
jgi:succinate dehydrogenase / fumarate reductase cytochrome b subunit